MAGRDGTNAPPFASHHVRRNVSQRAIRHLLDHVGPKQHCLALLLGNVTNLVPMQSTKAELSDGLSVHIGRVGASSER